MKRILSVFICIVLMCPLAVTVGATDPFTVSVTADKESAEVGDTVSFTVSLSGAAESSSGSIEVIPGDGMEVVSGEMIAANTSLASYDLSKNKGVVGFSALTVPSGNFARITVNLTGEVSGAWTLGVKVKLNPTGSEATSSGSVNVKSDEPEPVSVIVGSISAAPGETVSIDVSLENMPKIKSLAASDVQFDSDALEFTGAEWKTAGSILSSWDNSTGKGVAAFRTETDINGVILTLPFKVKDGTTPDEYTVGIKIIGRRADGTTLETVTVPGKVTVESAVLIGDVNNDGMITIRDLSELKRLLAGASEDEFNLANSDVSGDGLVTISDLSSLKKMLAG